MTSVNLHTGFSGRLSGWPVVCPRKGDIMPGARGRSLPVGWET
jgi:hypothetical protein